ncbi:hypothetical protein [Spirosoma flavum]|uniref:Uncharacterized protein n=1 Tax=Spirosoma flavum TaxID=2048557 RepID=A0ABW6ALF9_9BACT
MGQIIFRLKTAIVQVGVTEPVTIMPDIAEPVRWSDVPLTGSVDEKYHGFLSSYSDGTLKLDFRCESAHSLLSEQYYTYGTDADVRFQVIEVDRAGTEYIDFDGKIDFETILIVPGKVSVSIITNDDHTKFNSRFESPIALDSILTLDNVALSPATATEIPLAGQTLHEQGEFSHQKKYTESQAFTDGVDLGISVYVLPKMYFPASETVTATIAASPSAIQELSNLEGVNYLYGGVTPADIDPPSLLEVKANTIGDYHIEIDWLFHINVVLTKAALTIGSPKFAVLEFVPLVIVKIPGAVDQIIPLCPPKSGSGYANSVEHSFAGSYHADLDLPLGAQVYTYCKIVAFAKNRIKQIEFFIESTSLRISIERKTRAQATKTKAYLMPEAIRHVIGAITSTLNPAKTGNVYGGLIDNAHADQALDGYATEYAVTTGNQLRGIDKVPSFDAKTLIDTLWSQHAAGILFEHDVNTGAQAIRIEEGSWFYRGGEIAVIDEVFEYSEEPDLELLYNQIEVGYEKYPDSGAGVADEFNTVHTYQTPLISRENTLPILCPLIAAGTAIELERRLGIKQVDANGVPVSTTSDAGTYDDDGFILHVIAFGRADTFRFIVEGPTPVKPYTAHYIQFSNAIINGSSGGVLLYYGDKVTISGTGTPNDGKTFTIVGIHPGIANFTVTPTYEVDAAEPIIAGGPLAGSWQAGTQAVKLRTNERLDVSGIADPDTAFNLELSPSRMLRRHAAFINSGLAYKKPIDELRCTAYKQNGKVSSQVKPGVAPLPGDSDRQYIAETGNIALGSMEGFLKLFQPELIKVKGTVTRKMRRAIFAAMKNQGPDEVNCGYLTIINPDKSEVSGFLRSITYKDSSEVADIVLRKKRPAINPNEPTCEVFYNYTLKRFEIDPTADPNKYRFCRFRDFQPL